MNRKTYILDTNVLIHDPESIFHFHEHEVVIPFEALEELDLLKKRYDVIGQNARRIIRYLGNFVEQGCLQTGVDLDEGGTLRIDSTLAQPEAPCGRIADLTKADNRVIALALKCKEKHNGNTIFVSKDINARVKAQALGIKVEDYKTDRVDVESIYSGHADFFVDASVIGELHQAGEVPSERVGSTGTEFVENQCLLLTGPGNSSVLAIHKNGRIRKISRSNNAAWWGVRARNKEQHFAAELLSDPAIHAVSLIGQAGTGKTLLSLAVGLHKTLEEGTYQRILVTKPVIPVGKQQIGFLPGDKEAKMIPWVQSVFDNFSALCQTNQKLTVDYLMTTRLLEIESIGHIRGRSLAKCWIILDEAQNLTPREIKTVLSRVGEGSKIVVTGDIHQIDSPYLDAASNGLSFLVSRFKGQHLYGHITLARTIRSSIASLAAELL